MKLKKKIFVLLFFVGMFLFFHNDCYAGTQRLNSLDYDVRLNSDGSMDVVETWDIYVSETNTLFKDFNLDRDKFSGITNVKVMDMDTELELTQIDEEMYHVTKGCYYGLPISDGKFEIAWGVGLDDSSANRKYQISYTVEDIITVYNDCSELYWQFVGTENTMKAKKVMGTIKLPQEVKDLDHLRVWAHGPLNGEIHRTSKDTVTFQVNNFASQTMLEIRVAMEEPLFPNSTRKSSQNKLQKIIEEETKWADEANTERKKVRSIILIIVAINLVIFIFFLKKILKYNQELKKVKKEKYNIESMQYFRDIPREKETTPAEAAFLYYSDKNKFEIGSQISKVFSATLLQLCLKGYIAFEPEDKKDIRIHVIKNDDENRLKESEKKVLEILKKASFLNDGKSGATMKKVNEYAYKNYADFGRTMAEIESIPEKRHMAIGNYDAEKAKQVSRYKAKSIAYFIGMILMGFTVFLAIVLFPIMIEWMISCVILRKIANEINVLTEQGEMERQQWKALKRYMEDFSLLKEKEVPDLILWEKYLIYATAFGISEKVIKQLKVVYPEMANLNDNRFSYLYFMTDPYFEGGIIERLNHGTNGAYSSYLSAKRIAEAASYSSSGGSNYSSGSGSGGGFSSGGGGRCWRRPEWAEDKLFRKDRKMKIGIDIGGSHIGIGLIEGEKIVDSREKNFNREDRKNIEATILTSIQTLINELLQQNNLKIEDIELIGLAAPGTISNGVIVKAGNLNIENFDIISQLEKIYQNPLQIRNDGKCAALAEKEYGSLKEYEDCIFINIGTGIGGAAFMGGKLLEPKRYSGFEFGHMVLNKGGRLCSCGKRGCFEAYSSIKALKMKVTETLDVDSDISGQYLREELLVKDAPGVKEDIEVFLEYLKTGIANLIDIFEPEIIALGGSFAYYEGNPILDQLIQKLQEADATFNDGELPKIVTAKLKNDAGMIGAVIE